MDIARIIIFTLLGLNTLFLGAIFFILWKPLKQMHTAAAKLDTATARLDKAGDILEITKKYDGLIKMQSEQAKHAVERIPQQIQQGVQKAVAAATVPLVGNGNTDSGIHT